MSLKKYTGLQHDEPHSCQLSWHRLQRGNFWTFLVSSNCSQSNSNTTKPVLRDSSLVSTTSKRFSALQRTVARTTDEGFVAAPKSRPKGPFVKVTKNSWTRAWTSYSRTPSCLACYANSFPPFCTDESTSKTFWTEEFKSAKKTLFNEYLCLIVLQFKYQFKFFIYFFFEIYILFFWRIYFIIIGMPIY